jgi:hypothetical protein
MGLMVDPDAGAMAEVIGKRPRELSYAVVEIRKQWPVQVIFGKVRRGPVDVLGVEVRRRISLDHNRHRPKQCRTVAVLGGLGTTRGVRHRTGAEQHQAVDTLGIKLILQSCKALDAHPGEVRQSGDCNTADRRPC